MSNNNEHNGYWQKSVWEKFPSDFEFGVLVEGMKGLHFNTGDSIEDAATYWKGYHKLRESYPSGDWGCMPVWCVDRFLKSVEDGDKGACVAAWHVLLAHGLYGMVEKDEVLKPMWGGLGGAYDIWKESYLSKYPSIASVNVAGGDLIKYTVDFTLSMPQLLGGSVPANMIIMKSGVNKAKGLTVEDKVAEKIEKEIAKVVFQRPLLAPKSKWGKEMRAKLDSLTIDVDLV